MSVNKNEQIPLHYQLSNELRKSIMMGTWSLGEIFPTDKYLMERYSLSSTTVRRAVAELVNEGWLERKPGKGTFIKKEPVEETLGLLTGFFDEMISHGFTPSADILDMRQVDLTPKLLERTPGLSVFGNQSMFVIEKIQKLNNEPIAYVRSYWPYEYGKLIAESDLTSKGLYEVVKKELGLQLTRAEQVIGADLARTKVARYLDVAIGSPILTMERLGYSGNNPIELSINSYRADRYKYRVLLEQSDQKNVEGVFCETK
ncbi:MAG TPA: GntR family transcriptional regulator [Desulfosporosinus sp.]|nr:GntR family transcriptional regulator [Desulfosporosinus sp.]